MLAVVYLLGAAVADLPTPDKIAAVRGGQAQGGVGPTRQGPGPQRRGPGPCARQGLGQASVGVSRSGVSTSGRAGLGWPSGPT